MGPDEEKRLRQIMIKERRLPDPAWNLIARATKKMSRAGKLLKTPKTPIAKTDVIKD